MDYERSKLALKYGLLVDLNTESSLLNETDIQENPQKIVEILLWKTVWQCREYFIPNDFFGAIPPKQGTDLTRIQLVSSIDRNFEYLQRRIIIENIAMDLFLSLGRTVHSEEVISDGTKYLILFNNAGYFQMTNCILDGSGKIKNKSLNLALKTKYNADKESNKNFFENERKNLTLSPFINNSYILQCAENSESIKKTLEILKQRKESKKIAIPLFDCRLIAMAIHNPKMINQMHDIPIQEDITKKLELINRHRTAISKLESEIDTSSLPFTKEMSKDDSSKDNTDFVKYLNLDNNICYYCVEKLLHVRLQHDVLHICDKLSKEYGLEATHLQDALINTANMNLQFGMHYLLGFPLTYIHSPSIRIDNKSWHSDNKNFYVNPYEAERIWIKKYCQYLETLSYVTVPVVRTAFEINLYTFCKNAFPDKDDAAITEKMFNLLESYETNYSDCVNFDYTTANPAEYLSSSTYYLTDKADDYIKDAISLKEKYNFTNASKKVLPNIKKDEYLIREMVTKMYDTWYNPENFQQFWNKSIDERYCDLTNDYDMQYYRQKIIETRTESIIVKHNQKWNSK